MTARLVVVALMCTALSVWTHARPVSSAAAPPNFNAAIPLALGDWVGRDAPPLDPDVLRVLAADDYVHRYYGPRVPNHGERTADSGSRVEMDIAYYAQPQAGAAMHSPLSCLPGNGWQVIESTTMAVPLAQGSVDVRRLLVARGADRVAMTYWFQNRGAIVGNEYRQRLQLLSNGLKGRPTDAALVRVMSLDTAAGHRSLAAFSRELARQLGVVFGL
jgi:EpsI family protein